MNKRVKVIINLLAIVLFIAILTWISVIYFDDIVKIVKDPMKFREYILSFKSKSILVFIFFQALQVIISAIPGEVIQISGGFLFGTLLGSIYSFIGILLGSVIVFYLSRILGFNLVKELIPKKTLDKFNFVINNQKTEIAIFILFLIPGIPKDILTYVAGLSLINPKRFLLIISIARFPGIFFSSYIGSHLQKQNYTEAIIIALISTLLFMFGLIFRNKIINIAEKIVKRKSE